MSKTVIEKNVYVPMSDGVKISVDVYDLINWAAKQPWSDGKVGTYHPHTRESVKPVKPGEINEYAIEIIPIAHVFKTGHCLELEIRNTESIKDPLFNEIWPCGYHLPISKTVAHWIYQDAEHQSHLLVPMIPRE